MAHETVIPPRKLVEDSSEKAETRTESGWPAWSRIPFVEPSYYEQFAERVRPRFEAGGGSSLNVTSEEMDRARDKWNQPWKIVTVFNFSLSEHTLVIPGPRPGQTVHVTMMPFGIIRAPYDVLPIGKGMHGSDFAQVYQVPVEGNCKKAARVKDPENSNFQIESCPYYNCPEHPSFGLIHSIGQAYHVVQSIGEALRSGIGADSPSDYTPEFDMVSKRLMAYQELDPRQLVGMWASKRLMTLNKLESEIQRRKMRGLSVGGR